MQNTFYDDTTNGYPYTPPAAAALANQDGFGNPINQSAFAQPTPMQFATGNGAAPAGAQLPSWIPNLATNPDTTAAASVPPWQVATGAGAAPGGSFLPDWMAGQPSQAGATDANGAPISTVNAQPSGPQASGGGGGAGGGSGAPGGGITNPDLYTPWTGTPPSYTPPTLPNVPSFSDYYTPPPTPTYTPPPAPDMPTYTPPPAFVPPTYQAPTIKQAPAFSYADFQAPTLAEAQNQPGYQFGLQQGEQALQQSRAAQGTLRTGGTLKDILDYGRNAATQNYQNVFNQDQSVYNTNRAGAVGAYNTNYQTQYADPNAQAAQQAQASFQNQLTAGQTSYQDQLASGQNAFQDQYNATQAKYQDQLAGGQNAFQNQLNANAANLTQAQAQYAPQLLQYQTNTANLQRQAELGYNADWQKYLDQENVFYNNQSGPFSKYLSLAQLGSVVA